MWGCESDRKAKPNKKGIKKVVFNIESKCQLANQQINEHVLSKHCHPIPPVPPTPADPEERGQHNNYHSQ